MIGWWLNKMDYLLIMMWLIKLISNYLSEAFLLKQQNCYYYFTFLCYLASEDRVVLFLIIFLTDWNSAKAYWPLWIIYGG